MHPTEDNHRTTIGTKGMLQATSEVEAAMASVGLERPEGVRMSVRCLLQSLIFRILRW